MTLAGGARWTGREGLASTQELWRKGVFSWRKKRVGSQRPRWSLWLFMNVGLMAWPLFWSGTWRSTCFSKCCYWKWDAEGPVLLTIKWSSHWRNSILPWGKTGHKGQAIFTGSCRWVGGGSRILVGQPREPAHGWEDAQMTHLCLWLSVVRASANCKLLQATTGIPRIEGQGTASQTSWKACSGPEVTSATEATALLQRRPPRGVTPSLYTPEPGGMQTSPGECIRTLAHLQLQKDEIRSEQIQTSGFPFLFSVPFLGKILCFLRKPNFNTLSSLCFWSVVLEKTLESPLDCKEIQPGHPKGNQSWIFIGRTDAEAETPILWPPDAKNWLIWKDPNAGKDWGQEEKRTTEDGWMASLTQWTWV